MQAVKIVRKLVLFFHTKKQRKGKRRGITLRLNFLLFAVYLLFPMGYAAE